MSVGMDVIKVGIAPGGPEAATRGPEPASGAQAGRSQPPPRGPAQKSIPGALLVPIDLVERDPAQPRRDWKHSEGLQRLEELTQSVREFGILQPLLVRQERDRYVVIAGGRRLVAARRAGMTDVPVVVRHPDSATGRILRLLENPQRREPSPPRAAERHHELLDP